jgi:hypothetical protein
MVTSQNFMDRFINLILAMIRSGCNRKIGDEPGLQVGKYESLIEKNNLI